MVPVAINIHPGGNPNSVELPNSTVPVGILTTAWGQYGLPLAFDVAWIDPTSLRFGPPAVLAAGRGAEESHGRGHREDVVERTSTPTETTRDGDIDLMAHFSPAAAELGVNDTQACITGRYRSIHAPDVPVCWLPRHTDCAARHAPASGVRPGLAAPARLAMISDALVAGRARCRSGDIRDQIGRLRLDVSGDAIVATPGSPTGQLAAAR
ncbi:MAG TPA: hypothetical protein VFC19_50015 [Candidatus Limnocylindrales bacterium]|nr:hypothetical protein [Candidatus Limnocylindrales bacterium]